GTEHHEVQVRDCDIGRVFPQVIWHTEKPILRTAPAPLFLLSRLVRQNGYKVVLTGEGSDEILGGYDIYKEAKIRRYCAIRPTSRIRPLLFKRLYPYLAKLQAQSPAYLQGFFRASAEDLSNPFFSHLPRWELTSRIKLFYSDDVRGELQAGKRYEELEARLPDGFTQWDPLSQAQYLEATVLLPGYVLSSQGDRMSMAHGVEGRVPFLDQRVVEFATWIPSSLKMKALDEKYILKRCAKGLVPPSVRKRPKQPYRAPDGKSFFGSREPEYVRALFDPDRLRKHGLFHPVAVQKLIGKVRRGQVVGLKDNMAVVGILSTELLMDQFVDRLAEVE